MKGRRRRSDVSRRRRDPRQLSREANMRKIAIGLGVAFPLALWLGACSGDDNGGGGAGAGGSKAGAGGASAAGAGGATGGSTGGGGQGTTGGAGQGGSQAGSKGDGGGDGGVPPDAPTPGPLAVYVMSNAAAANQILGFKRAADGKLTPMAAAFATGGKGSGAGLGEQGALAFDRAKNLVYTVNAGDNSFSILPVKDDGTLGAATHVATPDADAGGARLLGPKSITFHDDSVYVLFQGDATNASMISGWTVSSAGGALSAAP